MAKLNPIYVQGVVAGAGGGKRWKSWRGYFNLAGRDPRGRAAATATRLAEPKTRCGLRQRANTASAILCHVDHAKHSATTIY